MENAINIFDMIPEQEKKRKELIIKTCLFIRDSYKQGKPKEEIAELVKKIELPLDIHMAVFGRFSEICKHGKILTKQERLIFG